MKHHSAALPISSRLTLVGMALAGSLLATAALAADNTPPAGFVAIFNGKDLTGWKGLVATPPKRTR